MVDKIIVKYSPKKSSESARNSGQTSAFGWARLIRRLLLGFAQINDKAIAKNVDVVASDNTGHEIWPYKPHCIFGIVITIDFRNFLDVEPVAIGAIRIALRWPQQSAVHHVDTAGISGNIAANNDGIALVRNN